jgi:hypothetical protein
MAALTAMLVFAAGTATSMAAVSAVVGRLLGTRPAANRLETVVPALAALGAAFGVWYAASAAGPFLEAL